MKRKNCKKYLILAVLLVCALGLTGCCLSHSWVEADCVSPKTCTKCEKTEGAPLGHTWVEATCTAAQTCSVCGAQEGSVAEHIWTDATCTAPKTCAVCLAQEGDVTEHQYTWTVTQEPGVARAGSQEGVCDACGAAVTEELAALVPQYAWAVPVTLELTPDAVEVCISRGDGDYRIDFACAALSSRDLIALMMNSPMDWGLDKAAIFQQFSQVLTGFQDAWEENNNACCTMEEEGRTWTSVLSMDETANAFLRLQVDDLESFQTVTGLHLEG